MEILSLAVSLAPPSLLIKPPPFFKEASPPLPSLEGTPLLIKGTPPFNKRVWPLYRGDLSCRRWATHDNEICSTYFLVKWRLNIQTHDGTINITWEQKNEPSQTSHFLELVGSTSIFCHTCRQFRNGTCPSAYKDPDSAHKIPLAQFTATSNSELKICLGSLWLPNRLMMFFLLSLLSAF